MRAIGIAMAAALACSVLPAQAQQGGPPVPPYTPPVVQQPEKRDGDQAVGISREVGRESLPAADLAGFQQAYGRKGRPRLAIFWNRSLNDTLGEWYGNDRVVIRDNSAGSVGGKPESRTGETSIEHQRRAGGASGRYQPSETWEWAFEDGFMKPMFDAGVVMVDRAAIMRLTAANKAAASGGTADNQLIEAIALQNMADYLVEVLTSPSSKSRVGYELRARVIDVKNGQIVSSVNSRRMPGWGPDKNQYVASDRGFQKVEDETVGPTGGKVEYRGSSSGFEKREKPPRIEEIAQNLATNVMNGLALVWSR